MKAGRFVITGLAALAFFLSVAAPAAQVLPVAVPKASPTATPAPGPTIQTETSGSSDARIARRVRGIFSELPALAHVTVEVQQGVVTLGGGVENAADKAKAEGIANRVSGVVTVENKIARDTSIDSGVAGLKKVSDKFAAFAAGLPLFGVALLAALLIGALGYMIAGLRGMWLRVARNPFLAELIGSAIRFVFVLGGIVVALDIIGAAALMGAVLGGAGVLGLALGFAMRDTIENYVSSLMLSLRQPFRANDKVKIGDCEGRVVRLTTRATILISDEGNHVRVPNATVFKAVIVNYTRNPQRRFDFVLQIDTRADPAKARRYGYQALKALDFVLDDPPPAATVKDILYPNIALRFVGWLDQSKTDFGKGRSQAIEAVKRALEENGLGLPAGEAAEEAGDKPARRKPATAGPNDSEANDLSPEHAVKEMVHEERADAANKKDLLDPGRPEE